MSVTCVYIGGKMDCDHRLTLHAPALSSVVPMFPGFKRPVPGAVTLPEV